MYEVFLLQLLDFSERTKSRIKYKVGENDIFSLECFILRMALSQTDVRRFVDVISAATVENYLEELAGFRVEFCPNCFRKMPTIVGCN